MIVVDASVATKWMLDEPSSAAALELLESGSHLLAPDLARIEVGNAILRACRSGALTEPVARDRLRAWDATIDQHALELVPTRTVYAGAVELALEISHPLPDCLYLALARDCGAELVTADKLLYTRGRSVYERVCLLGQTT